MYYDAKDLKISESIPATHFGRYGHICRLIFPFIQGLMDDTKDWSGSENTATEGVVISFVSTASQSQMLRNRTKMFAMEKILWIPVLLWLYMIFPSMFCISGNLLCILAKQGFRVVPLSIQNNFFYAADGSATYLCMWLCVSVQR